MSSVLKPLGHRVIPVEQPRRIVDTLPLAIEEDREPPVTIHANLRRERRRQPHETRGGAGVHAQFIGNRDHS